MTPLSVLALAWLAIFLLDKWTDRQAKKQRFIDRAMGVNRG